MITRTLEQQPVDTLVEVHLEGTSVPPTVPVPVRCRWFLSSCSFEGWLKHRCSNTSGLQRGRSESFRIRRRLEEPPRPPPTDERPPPSHSCPGTILWSGEVAQMKQISRAATPARNMAATGEASRLTEERRIHASGTTTLQQATAVPPPLASTLPPQLWP